MNEWFKKNILFISDLLDENGCYLNIQDLQNKYSVETNFLTFYGLQKSIKAFMKSLKIIKEEENFKPFVPFNLKLFCTTKKGTKIMYNLLMTLNVDTNVISFNKQKWGRHFTLSKLQWQIIYQLSFINMKSSKLQWLQYRINHYILTTTHVSKGRYQE